MGILHAVYGVGATCAPLVSTQFAQLRRWSFGYLVHIGLALMSAMFQAFAFKFKSQDGMSRSLYSHRHQNLTLNCAHADRIATRWRQIA